MDDPVVAARITVRSIDRSDSTTLDTIRFVFLSGPRLGGCVRGFAGVSTVVVTDRDIRGTILSSKMVVFSVRLFVDSAPVGEVAARVPGPTACSWQP